jgi:hypothetical protein
LAVAVAVLMLFLAPDLAAVAVDYDTKIVIQFRPAIPIR